MDPPDPQHKPSITIRKHHEGQPRSEAARAAAEAWASKKLDQRSPTKPSETMQQDELDYVTAKRLLEQADVDLDCLPDDTPLLGTSPSDLDTTSLHGQKRKRESSPESSVDESTAAMEALMQVHKFGDDLMARTCQLCRVPIISMLDIVDHVESWATIQGAASAPDTNVVPAVVACPAGCGTCMCLGCGNIHTGMAEDGSDSKKAHSIQDPDTTTTGTPSSRLPGPDNKKASLRPRRKKAEKAGGTDVTKPQHDQSSVRVLSCCDEGRLVTVWMLLCYLDHTERQHEAKAAQKSIPWVKSSKKSKGIGYAKDEYYDYYYSDADDGDRDGSRSPHRYGPGQRLGTGEDSQDEKKQKIMKKETARLKPKSEKESSDDTRESRDKLMQAIFETLTRVLAGLSIDAASLPPLRSMLKLSVALDITAELLRNGSIDDVLARHNLYTTLFDFASALFDIPGLHDLIVEDRPGKEYKGDFQTLTFDKAVQRTKADRTPAIRRSMSDLTAVCQSILEAAKSMPEEYKRSIDLLNMCKRITGLANRIESASPHEGTTHLDLTQLDPWKKFCRDKCVEHVEDEEVLSQHHYKEAALKVQSVRSNRMKRLIQEIAAMKVSLPEGIFLKVPLSRPDVLKAMIVGPCGTPYAGGLFEFDIFCPGHYPVVPPEVSFKGAVHHRFSINPNLHPGGQVCLSLLGTWDGRPEEKWQPNVSTLEQVLVSIQAMVFCPNPIANEPGEQDVSEDDSEANEFNADVQLLTVRYGLLEWLQTKAEAQESDKKVWAEFMRNYFSLNASRLLETVRAWAKSNNEIISYTAEEPHLPPQAAKGGIHLGSGEWVTGGGREGGRNLLKELEAALEKYVGGLSAEGQ